MTYAENTTVSVEKSKAELDALLRRHGAAQRVFGDDDERGTAFAVFRLADRHYRLEIPMPKLEDFSTRAKGERGRLFGKRSPDEQRKHHEQACRARWRAVLLVVKAKLELVAMGVSSIEREFFADLLLPDGRTMHRALAEQIEASYKTGAMPPLLGMGGPS